MLKAKCIRGTVLRGAYRHPGDIAVVGVSCPASFERPGGPVLLEPLPVVFGGSVALLADGPSGRRCSDLGIPVAVVNRAGVRYPGPVAHWFSMHPQYLARWLHKRRKAGHPSDDITFSSHLAVRNPRVSLFTDAPVQGSSALLAFMALEAMGYDHIHLVGVDFTGPYAIFKDAWNKHIPQVYVTSDNPDLGYER